MAKLIPSSLRGRMALTFLTPAVLAFVGLIALAWFASRATLEEEVGGRLRDVATVSAAQLNSGLVARYQPGSARTHSNLLKRLEKVATATGARRVFLIDAKGNSLVDTATDAPAPGQPDRTLTEDRFELDQVLAVSPLPRRSTPPSTARATSAAMPPSPTKAWWSPSWAVEASASSYAGLDALGAYLIAVGIFALGLLTLMVIFFSRALSAPLARLAQAASRIGAGDLAQPIETQTKRPNYRCSGARWKRCATPCCNATASFK